MKKHIPIMVTMTLILLLTGMALDDDRYWQEHDRPYDFLFGNHIDTHQETRLFTRGKNEGNLRGWFYVFDSTETLDDGTPILKHCTKPAHYAAGCVAGWEMEARPCIQEVNGCRAMFLYHYHDHPVWLLGAFVDNEGGLQGSRQDIVQPGSFTHFHWLTEGVDEDDDGDVDFPSSLEDVESVFGNINVPEECNVARASKLTSGVECPGYFLQIEALNPFGYEEWAFHHGGESLVVRSGLDNKTHLNLLTSYRSLPAEVLPGNYAE